MPKLLSHSRRHGFWWSPGHSFVSSDGIYVLVQHPSRHQPNGSGAHSVPSSLLHLVVDDIPESKSFRWNLSGPQKAKSANIQMRYCNPKGQTDFYRRRSIAFWTVVSPILVCFLLLFLFSSSYIAFVDRFISTLLKISFVVRLLLSPCILLRNREMRMGLKTLSTGSSRCIRQ